MAAWSSMLRCTVKKFAEFTAVIPKNALNNGQLRYMSDHARTMPIRASRWQWQKTKDYVHFYVMLGAIPLGILIFCTYVFVGPATLEPIPEGYIPKHWEYYRNPITRFIARYLTVSPQQEYEKYLAVLYNEKEVQKIKLLTQRIESFMAERKDYRKFYFVPTEDLHKRHQVDEKLEDLQPTIKMDFRDI